jgi:hypothetical protein
VFLFTAFMLFQSTLTSSAYLYIRRQRVPLNFKVFLDLPTFLYKDSTRFVTFLKFIVASIQIFSLIKFASQIFPLFVLLCTLASHLPQFRSTPIIWLGFCNHCNLNFFFDLRVLHFLQQLCLMLLQYIFGQNFDILSHNIQIVITITTHSFEHLYIKYTYMPPSVYQDMTNLTVNFHHKSICIYNALLTIIILDVAKFTILTPASLISCKLLLSLAGYNIFSVKTLALKSPKKSSCGA